VSAPQTKSRNFAEFVPPVLRVSTAVCWRILVLLGTLYVLGRVASELYLVLIPVAIALLLAALLAPAVSRLNHLRVPRALSTAIVLIGGLASVVGVFYFVINKFITGFPQLETSLIQGLNNLHRWLIVGPLHLREEQITAYLHQAQQWLQNNQATLTSGALSTAQNLASVLTGLALVLFTLIFFLHDGRGIWLFLLGIVPRELRERVDLAGRRGFAQLSSYVRATAFVAVVDALGVLLGLLILQVPLPLPLSALVFLGAFVPILGAVVSGSVAVLVALVAKGWISALLVIAVLLAVNQIEGNIMQPLVMGRAVRIHPLATVLGISTGFLVSGIVGALLAVPLIAVLNSAVRSLMTPDDVVPPRSETTTSEADTTSEAEPTAPEEPAPPEGHEPPDKDES
jgi:putative heme transporter